MLRIILLIIISYLVIRIALRLLLTESPSQRRDHVRNGKNSQYQSNSTFESGKKNKPGYDRFDHIEDAEFEEIPPGNPDEKK
ncbi:MAG: hypothetical protein WD097_01060 [Balneolales bacterium]